MQSHTVLVPEHMRTPIALRAIASRQGGCVLNRQIRECGISPGIKARRIAAGIWRQHLGVIVIPECVTSTDLRDGWAMALRIGTGAIITGPTAARMQGRLLQCDLILGISPVDIHLRVPGARILRRRPLFPTRHRGRCGRTDRVCERFTRGDTCLAPAAPPRAGAEILTET